jgi:hypothetical protein
MKLYAMFLMDIERGTPETDAVFEHLREHTKLSLQIRKILGTKGRAHVSPEMMEQHKASSAELGRLLGKCFADQPLISLEDCKWDSQSVLTREEEACILAPEG